MRHDIAGAQRIATRNRYKVECIGHFHADGVQCPFHGQTAFCGQAQHVARVKWRETFFNVVVTVGLNELLNRSFDAVAANVLWYVGLIGAGTGTVGITSALFAVTGSGTAFAAGDNASDIVIVGAGAAGADLFTTVNGNPSSATALNTVAAAGSTVSGASYAIEPRAADTMASKSFNETVPYSNATRPAWTKNGTASAGAMSNSSAKAAFTINATGRVFGLFLANDNTKSGTAGVLYGGGLFSGGSRAVQSGDTLNGQIDLSAVSQ